MTTKRPLGLFLATLALAALSGCASIPPLHKAIVSGDTAKSDELIASGGKNGANEADAWGSVPLTLAAQSSNVSTVTKLIAAGADVNYANTSWGYGFTPLHAAAETGNTAVVKKLVEAGADVKAKTSFGWSAVTLAALQNRMDTVEYLQSKGASISVKETAELDQSQHCSYANGRADGYAWADHFKGVFTKPDDSLAGYRGFACKAHCPRNPGDPNGFDVSVLTGKDERLTSPVGNFVNYCKQGDADQAYAQGWDVGVQTQQNEKEANGQAILGAVRAAGNVAQAAAGGNSAGQSAAMSLNASGGLVESVTADRKIANFEARKSHAKGCPEFAPWRLADDCFGTERQACGGKRGCGAVND